MVTSVARKVLVGAIYKVKQFGGGKRSHKLLTSKLVRQRLKRLDR